MISHSFLSLIRCDNADGNIVASKPKKNNTSKMAHVMGMIRIEAFVQSCHTFRDKILSIEF